MRDLDREMTMLEVARQGWQHLNNEWSRITISATHEPGTKRLGKSYEAAVRSLVKQAGGDSRTDVRIDNSDSNIANGGAAMTIEMKTSVLEQVRELDAPQPLLLMA